MTEIEVVVDKKFDDKREALATKEDVANAVGVFRKEVAESKTDLIKWMVGLSIPLYLTIVGLIVTIALKL